MTVKDTAPKDDVEL